jgi:acyl-homoserine lactone acylase PvdQ
MFHLSSIVRAVQKRPVMTFTEFEELQKDYGRRVFFADYFLPYVFKAAERTGAWKDARLGVALRQLQAWDRYLTDMSVPAAIFMAWLEQVKQLLFADQFGDLYPQLFGGTLQERGASVLLRVFEGKKAALPLKYDYLHGRNMDAVIIKALSQGLDQLTKKYGTKQMNRWFERDQKINFEGLGWIPWYSRGTYIQVVECSSPEISGVNIVAPGQSEDPKSPHYGDQRELAGYWMFKPMVLSRAAWEK